MKTNHLFIIFICFSQWLMSQSVNYTILEKGTSITNHTIFPKIKVLTSLPHLNTVIVPYCDNDRALGYSISTDAGKNWKKGDGYTNPNLDKQLFGEYPKTLIFNNSADSLLTLHFQSGLMDKDTYKWSGLLQNTSLFTYNSPEDFLISQQNIAYPLQENEQYPVDIVQEGYNNTTAWAVNTSLSSPQIFYIMKGKYDPIKKEVDWHHFQTLSPNCNTFTTDGQGIAMILGGQLIFSPDGSKGYFVTQGDIKGGKEGDLLPIIWTYDAANQKWSEPVELDLNTIPGLEKNQAVSKFDLSIDKFNRLHIFAALGQSSPPYSMEAGFVLYDLVNMNPANLSEWDAFTIDSMYKTFQYNISRSMDGRYIFYSWFKDANLWGKMVDTETWQASSNKKWEVESFMLENICSQALYCADYVMENTDHQNKSTIFSVPTSLLEYDLCFSKPLYYLSNISYRTDEVLSPIDFTSSHVELSQIGNIQSISLFPNPSKDALQLELILAKSQNIHFDIIDAIGRVIYKEDLGNGKKLNTKIDVSSYATGIYFIQIQTEGEKKTLRFIRN